MTKFVRRLQRIGSSILVSLPKEWVDANKLDKSSQVELETGQDNISISANKETRPTKELVISYPLPKEENIVADITGGYLLGYDIIEITSDSIIPGEDREKIRNSMRRLVGMEIIEEDASHINMQFLLDSTTLNPQKILKRMSSIAIGMYDDATNGLIADDKSNLQTLSKRDEEVNRQYFLLVRLIRSTLVDKRLANAFNLENIDVLDYRVAANLLENTGDSIVELSDFIYNSSLSKDQYKKIHDVVKNFNQLAEKSIDAFTKPDRLLAIEAISLHKKFEDQLSKLRTSLGTKKEIPIDFLDMVFMFERIAQSWADVADLVQPIYNK
ncbi:phosphate signaling complex PhoU family protein [Nitrosopumilus maritimus]|uniref:Phosphate uptake regulator, PhoU n=1 Tax=Nitrosopumilus maritimus (strain SCM1) TaxID=436308 RepID=A9A2T6_NITMS|nr:phosphate uptake regulator PhoU [Nitrosopumilus maritimus]ABX13613.1 phosphate uptake regulator, PhoU [Nitrosopumilus maritimus SCM1]